jgi:UDPglucose 6-dehydrogenase
MNICVIGTGYVGLVSGTCFADIGHDVICVDNDEKKIETLLKDEIPIYEPGLKELVMHNKKQNRLKFSTNIEEGVQKSDCIFIAVGTPQKETGEADLSYIEAVARSVAKSMTEYKIIVEKSTVPVKTGEMVKRTIKFNNKSNVNFDVCSNPEFLREGSAIYDFMYPDRIVVGVSSDLAGQKMREIYKPIIDQSFSKNSYYFKHHADESPFDKGHKVPIIVTDVNSAELIKHASNSFLAMKISYINALSEVCEHTNANILEVAQGIGLDSRIGDKFLDAGVGFGGSCFPKDVIAFYNISKEIGLDFKLLKDVLDINQYQKKRFIKKIEKALWIIKDKTIGILGLAFKPNTDDMREAPAIDIINALLKDGAKIKAYDPEAMEVSKKILKKVEYCESPYDVAENADALVLVTEWDEFKKLDMKKIYEKLNYPILVDGRNAFNPTEMRNIGFEYHGIGLK